MHLLSRLSNMLSDSVLPGFALGRTCHFCSAGAQYALQQWVLGLADAELLWGLARVLLEVAAQERGVAELIVPCDLLDAVCAGAQLSRW